MAEALDLAVTAWSLLGGGLLSGKYRTGQQGRRDHGGGPFRPQDARAARILDAVLGVAGTTGATPAQVAIAWARQQPWRTVPVLGARTPEQLRDNPGALQLTLDADALARLDEVSARPLGFPHELTRSQAHLDSVTGGRAADLDHRR